MPDPNDLNDMPILKFTVKEMFDQIRGQLAQIDAKLSHKAEQSVVDIIQRDVELLKVAELKRVAVEATLAAKGADAVLERHWRVPVLLSVLNIGLIVAEVLLGLRLHN